jgi:L,D-peptidoglycan transpeptidase YkuD (ErfK/YbiS/YcfS/YnhG family)
MNRYSTQPRLECPSGYSDLFVFHTSTARMLGHNFPCSIGSAGLRRNKIEGDCAVPCGVWQIEQVLYRADKIPRPRTCVPVFPIHRWMCWCSDPQSKLYNTLIHEKNLTIGERLFRNDNLYDCIAILNYNRPNAILGKGSAIFLHIWRRPHYPTKGCIAFSKTHLLWILAAWRPYSSVSAENR